MAGRNISKRNLTDLNRSPFIVNHALNGKTNNVTEITLSAGTSTVITDVNIGKLSYIDLQPMTQNAANLSWYISAYGVRTATITYPNDANVDLDFRMVVVG
jgi:hypothetical protein